MDSRSFHILSHLKMKKDDSLATTEKKSILTKENASAGRPSKKNAVQAVETDTPKA